MRDRRIIRQCAKCDQPCVPGSGQKFCADHKLTKTGQSQTPHAQRAMKYGVTVDDLIQMEIDQDYRCAICGNLEPRFKSGERMSLAVDHDHITNEVRGLLCSNCNRGLGFLGDNIENVRAALAYLEKEKF